MQLGIFTKTFQRNNLGEVLDAVASHGLTAVQFNLSDAGLSDTPDALDPIICRQIGAEHAARRIELSAVSGTYNMIHPDPKERQIGLRHLEVIIAACKPLGTKMVTLCTGTRDPLNMWRRHPDNDAPEAWKDLAHEMAKALEIAEAHGVILGVEPEVSNVMDSAQKARRLLDEMRSPNLKIVMDGANVFHHGELPRMKEILDEAFALLGADIGLAHAKDLDRDGEAGNVAAGKGKLDYDHYLHLLKSSSFSGALILHSLSEEEVPASVKFVRERMRG